MKRGWWNYVPHFALAVGAVLLLLRLRMVLAPFLIAYLLAAALDPLVVRMEGHGWRRGRAVAYIYACFLLLFIIFISTVVPVAVTQVRELANDLPTYVEKAPALMESLRARLGSVELPQYLRDAIMSNAGKVSEAVANKVAGWAQGVIGSVGFLIWLVLIPIATFLLLNDIRHVRASLLLMVPHRHRAATQEIAHDVASVFVSYLRGLAVVAILYGVTVALVLLAVGMPYAVALGVMAGVLYPVPYVGTTLTTVTVLIVGAATEGWGMGLTATGAAVVSNLLFDQLLFPRIVGHSVGLHPVLCMLSLLVGAELLGLPGMLIAYPAAGAIRIIVVRLLPRFRSEPESLAAVEAVDALPEPRSADPESETAGVRKGS